VIQYGEFKWYREVAAEGCVSCQGSGSGGGAPVTWQGSTGDGSGGFVVERAGALMKPAPDLCLCHIGLSSD